MKCQRCKEREVSVQIIQQAPGKKPQTFLLCDVCASEMGISIPKFPTPGKTAASPFTTMGNVFQSKYGLGAEESSLPQSVSCDQCKMTFEEFKKTGFLGCPHCYEMFASQMDPVFCRTQMGKKHVGRKLGRKPAKDTEEALSPEDSCAVEWILAEEDTDPDVRGRSEEDTLSVVNFEPGTHNGTTSSSKNASLQESLASSAVEETEALRVLEKQHMARLMEEKKAELSAAVSAENYGHAAKIRDELEEMKRSVKEWQ